MFDRRRATAVAVAVGAVGAALALVLEADVGLGDGIWYPVVYAGFPAVAATAAFARERSTASPAVLLGVAGWLLVSSVLALAGAVVVALGFPRETATEPVVALVFSLLLYLGYLAVPVGAAVVAARRDDFSTAVPLALSPLGQVLVALALALLG